MQKDTKLETIDDVMRLLHKPLGSDAYKVPLTDDDVVEIVGTAIAVEASDSRDQWDYYPQLGLITSLMTDLELPEDMIGDRDKVYLEVQRRFAILDAFVYGIFLHDSDREQIARFESKTEVADYWHGLAQSDRSNSTKRIINVVGNIHFQDWYFHDPLLASTFNLLCDVEVSQGLNWQEAKRRTELLHALIHSTFLYEYDHEKIASLQSVNELLDYWSRLCPTEIDFADPDLATHTQHIAQRMVNVTGNAQFKEWYNQNRQLAELFTRLGYIATGWDSPGIWRDGIRPMLCDLKGEGHDSPCREVVYKNVS